MVLVGGSCAWIVVIASAWLCIQPCYVFSHQSLLAPLRGEYRYTEKAYFVGEPRTQSNPALELAKTLNPAASLPARRHVPRNHPTVLVVHPASTTHHPAPSARERTHGAASGPPPCFKSHMNHSGVYGGVLIISGC